MKILAVQRLRAYVTLAENIKQYVKRLKKMGIKRIGEGNNAEVFQHPTMPNVVVKLLTHDDAGYDRYVDFCRAHQGNKYCPQILDVHKDQGVFESSDPDLHLIFMEKLRPLNKAQYYEFLRYALTLLNYGERMDKLKTYPDAVKLMNNEKLWGNLAIQKEDQALSEVARFLVNGRPTSTYIDLNPGNLMLRGSQVVIVDPFFVV